MPGNEDSPSRKNLSACLPSWLVFMEYRLTIYVILTLKARSPVYHARLFTGPVRLQGQLALYNQVHKKSQQAVLT